MVVEAAPLPPMLCGRVSVVRYAYAVAVKDASVLLACLTAVCRAHVQSLSFPSSRNRLAYLARPCPKQLVGFVQLVVVAMVAASWGGGLYYDATISVFEMTKGVCLSIPLAGEAKQARSRSFE